MPIEKKSIKPKKQPTQERSRLTVDSILQATTYILIRDGYAGLTTNKVAEKAGVNIASLYQYFPNKEAMVLELLRSHVKEVRGVVKAAILAHSGKSLKKMIQAFVRAAIAAHAVNPALHRIFDEETPHLLHVIARAEGLNYPIDIIVGALVEKGFTYDQADRVAWFISTLSIAVIHRGIVERPEDFDAGIIQAQLESLLEAYVKKYRTV